MQAGVILVLGVTAGTAKSDRAGREREAGDEFVRGDMQVAMYQAGERFITHESRRVIVLRACKPHGLRQGAGLKTRDVAMSTRRASKVRDIAKGKAGLALPGRLESSEWLICH